MSKNNKKISKYLKFKFGLSQRISLYKKLKSYTESEFPITDALVKFKERYDLRKDFRGKIIGHWLNSMNQGLPFDKAIAGWVPESEVNLISAGLNGQGVEFGLAEAIKFSGSASKIKSSIIAGSVYPLILSGIVIAFIAMFSIQIAPTYLSMLPIERWPDSGRYFYYLSKMVVDYWFICLGLILGLVFIIQTTMGSWTGSTREFFDKLPPWSVYKVYQSSSFLISLSSLMRSGVPVNFALGRIKGTSSSWVAYYITQMEKNFMKGNKNFGKNLDVGLLDDEVAGDVIDYSELGSFEVAVYEIGEQSLLESVEKIDKRMAILKNAMIGIVGITVIVMYSTIIELNGIAAEAASNSAYM